MKEAFDATAWISVIGGIVASFIGLIVWLVKTSEKRAATVTDRYFAFLENKNAETAKVHEGYQRTLQENSDSVRSLAQSVEHNSDTLKNLYCSRQPVGGKD